METKALDIVRLLVELTKENKIRWQKVDSDRWETKASGQEFYVEFIYLARTDDVGSDRTIARLHAFLLFDYCIGTEGFDLICEMLSVGDTMWTEARESGQQRLNEGISFLRQFKER
jgi:hypothetical protein